MATVSLQAELTYRDGLKKKINVNINDDLTSMMAGIQTLNAEVSELLTELVQREKQSGGDCDDGEDDEDVDEDEEETTKQQSSKTDPEPPAKRFKSPKT